MRVMDLIPAHTTTQGSVDFYRIGTAASSASSVAEGAEKPEAPLVFEKVNAPVRKIAVWCEVTDEALSDYSQFATVVGQELFADVVNRENQQLLSGNGVAPDIQGMLGTSGVLTRAKDADSVLDALAKATNDLRVGASFAEADGIVLHPNDYLTAVLSKSSGSGEYMAVDPVAGAARSLWGLKVVLTTQITAGTALVGSFQECGMVLVRLAPRLDVNALGEAQFKKNTALIRVEERIGLAITRPTCLVKVTGL
jgi:HK97 family phage major capsid protein